ncbi:MAG TPA: 1-phosphofructokinase family hexose kinase [Bacteriovoracaceae bacterium]|nr:1-phosphofructokinase family hexose kinase [Bacteriovoracaceae bacterium]
MITTITFNPALDISGTVDNLIPNEKSYVYGEIQTPGGNGINAAIIATRLGAKVTASGLIGGPNGDVIMELLDKIKVKHAFIPITGKTRLNLTVNNCDNHKQTRLSFPGPKIKAAEMQNLTLFLQKTRDEMFVFGGSLPPGIKANAVASLVRACSRKGKICIVDMPGNLLKDIVKSKPYFVKPNLIEFQDLVGKKVNTIKTILPLVRKLNKWIPLICVSSVEGGAILVSKDEAWYGKIPKVKILSTVGAGDSMVGAISMRLDADPETSVEELLRWGLASSCATLTEKGMVLGSKKSIVKYYPQIIMKNLG